MRSSSAGTASASRLIARLWISCSGRVADRLSRSSPVDEHGFFKRRYLDDDSNPILIESEVVLTDLTEDVLTRFRIHLEYRNTATNELLDEMGCPEDVGGDDVMPALRVKFEGAYDIQEDEFKAETYFTSPPLEGEGRRSRVTCPANSVWDYPAVLPAAVDRNVLRSIIGASITSQGIGCQPPWGPEMALTEHLKRQGNTLVSPT